MLSGNAYDSGVVTDKVPDEQLCKARHQDYEKHGVCRPNSISEESGTATTDT